MSFGVFGLAVVVSHKSCKDNTKMACNLDARSYLSGQGHSLYMLLSSRRKLSHRL